jgi:dipeptidyl aminopeptidase/acylaminoacyl peptidase
VYVQRSPIHSAHKIKSPIIFFHGDRDVVVDISQTQKIAAALKQNNVYHEVHIFKDEGHGFKKSESIMTALIKELEFFNQYCL